jgi:hypothetical protein
VKSKENEEGGGDVVPEKIEKWNWYQKNSGNLRIESKNQVLMFNAMHAIFSGTSHDIHSNMKVIELH